MTWDEEENAVRQLGCLIGYNRLIHIARQLAAHDPKPTTVNMAIGHCAHGRSLNRDCDECAELVLQMHTDGEL